MVKKKKENKALSDTASKVHIYESEKNREVKKKKGGSVLAKETRWLATPSVVYFFLGGKEGRDGGLVLSYDSRPYRMREKKNASEGRPPGSRRKVWNVILFFSSS